ncbi:hypothetical protein DF186_15590, partial [Enterococcus hirae]
RILGAAKKVEQASLIGTLAVVPEADHGGIVGPAWRQIQGAHGLRRQGRGRRRRPFRACEQVLRRPRVQPATAGQEVEIVRVRIVGHEPAIIL